MVNRKLSYMNKLYVKFNHIHYTNFGVKVKFCNITSKRLSINAICTVHLRIFRYYLNVVVISVNELFHYW